MSKFLLKIIGLTILISSIYFLLGFLADGKTDPFYLRLTSPKQSSLIIGTSRAAQGIVPKVLNNIILKDNLEGDLYNYSFTILHSPFGETYYNAIEKKLDRQTIKGLFIIAVDPWSIASRTDIDHLRETELELAKITIYNNFPNYDYLKNAYQKSFFNLLIDKTFPEKSKPVSMFLHNDGWLEVSVDTTEGMILKASKEKINDYKNNQLPLNKISKDRLTYLEKTIKLLKTHGEVILIRIPVDKRMLIIENQLDPVFNDRMRKISDIYDISYLSYKDENYIFPDGNHLYKESGKKFSIKLAEDINQLFING